MLYPEIQPYHAFEIKVSDIHTLYVEECGNPQGSPILFLHGGPGAGISEKHRRFFNPNHYRIILFDQRGSGKSKPYAELEANTLKDLTADIEKIREKLEIKSWTVFGGSWGSTLALCYAIEYPQSVNHMILRGIFLCRKEEIDWFYQYGAHFIFPEEFEKYENEIPTDERHNMVKAYYKRLTSSDQHIQNHAAKAWSQWEGATICLVPDIQTQHEFSEISVSLARIECHFFYHNCFFPEDNYMLNNAHKIAQIPCDIIHGRYDIVCPVKNAWDLHKALPNSNFEIVATSGHAAFEIGITEALVRATDRLINSSDSVAQKSRRPQSTL